MTNSDSVRENEQDIKSKIQYGDFITLAKLINASTPDSARMRFNRKDPIAINAMKTIIENREKFIEGYKKETN